MRNVEIDPADRVALGDIDLLDPERYRSGSQHAAWHTLRAEAPVWPQTRADGLTFWSVTRYEDVLRVIKDHRTFSSAHGTILAVLDGDPAAGRAINLMDPPRHSALRIPTMRLLSASAVRAAGGVLQERVRALVDSWPDGEEFDLAPLLLGLPLMAVGDLIGIPEQHWADVASLAMSGVAPADPHFAIGDVARTLAMVHTQLFDILGGLVDERRGRPRNDVMSALLSVDENGCRLPVEDVVLNCYSFLMGANTTTPHAAAHMILAFAHRPDLWRALGQEIERVYWAVEESLRWASPTNHFVRRAVTPVQLGGVQLDEGDLVCAWIASANRDERMFSDPYSFDPTRTNNQHLAFGKGIHYCNGAHGARSVLSLLLTEMLTTFEDVQVSSPPVHLYSNFINGITELRVVLRRRRHGRARSGRTRTGVRV